MSVGQELLNVPLPQMVMSLGMGIAKAQQALDDNSLQTTLALADEKIDFVPKIVGTISSDGKTSSIQPITAQNIPLIAFIRPTWYQFSEATIEVSMDIKTTFQTETKIGVHSKVEAGWGPVSVSVNVDVEHNRKFGKEVHGTSKMSVTMVPVPPPPLLLPQVDIRFEEPATPATPK
jgi:hypothetical protein